MKYKSRQTHYTLYSVTFAHILVVTLKTLIKALFKRLKMKKINKFQVECIKFYVS